MDAKALSHIRRPLNLFGHTILIVFSITDFLQANTMGFVYRCDQEVAGRVLEKRFLDYGCQRTTEIY